MPAESFEEFVGSEIRLARKGQRISQAVLAALAGVRLESVQLLEAGGMRHVGESEFERVSDVVGLIDPLTWYRCEERH